MNRIETLVKPAIELVSKAFKIAGIEENLSEIQISEETLDTVVKALTDLRVLADLSYYESTDINAIHAREASRLTESIIRSVQLLMTTDSMMNRAVESLKLLKENLNAMHAE